MVKKSPGSKFRFFRPPVTQFSLELAQLLFSLLFFFLFMKLAFNKHIKVTESILGKKVPIMLKRGRFGAQNEKF